MTKTISPISPLAARYGKPIHPLKRISVMEPNEFEDLIEVWATQQGYLNVSHLGGAGDKGRDVCGFHSNQGFEGDWDNFQCKRYDSPLRPSDVWNDIGKLIWHVYSDAYPAPKIYKFAASKGIGTSLASLLKAPSKIKAEVLAKWADKIENSISATPVPLTPELEKFIDEFDFSLFGELPLIQIVADIKGTGYFIDTFGGGLPARPEPNKTPESFLPIEATYIEKLRIAYSEHGGKQIENCAGLASGTVYGKHLMRQRTAFFCAESLREFSKESVPEGTFAALQTNIQDGIQPVLDADHATSYARLNEALKQATLVPLTDNPLLDVAISRDRQGVCHQLANDGEIDWTPNA
jgi:hypothetical protein